MSEHSHLPWKADGAFIRDARGIYVADIGIALGDVNDRDYIVTAANAFPELVEACKAAIETIHAWHGDGEEWPIYAEHSPEMQTIYAALKAAGVTDA